MIELVVKGKTAAQMQMASKGSATMSIGSAHGTSYYPALIDKPSIEGHELVGDSTIQQIGVGTLSVQEIEKILYRID